MESNKSSAKGYSVQPLGQDSFVFTPKERKPKPSFKLEEITEVSGSEIMKLELMSGLICRIMKYQNEDEYKTPMVTFDLVDMEKKSIEFKAPRGWANGVGLAAFLVDHNQITQWEVTVMDLLCRAFLFGIQSDFKSTIEKFNVKISQQVDWFIKNRLD
jgi:hypothetical protein